jgi:hypothetical protein
MSDWTTEDNVTCVVCPGCAFTFDAIHTNPEGGYSCPVCAAVLAAGTTRRPTRRSMSIESEMDRLARNGRYDVEVHVVNAGTEARFFVAEIREPAWEAVARHSPYGLQTLYGYGSGDTIAEALASCERVALSRIEETEDDLHPYYEVDDD